MALPQKKMLRTKSTLGTERGGSDVVSSNVEVHVRFRNWTANDIENNKKTEFDLVCKKALKGIDFVITEGRLVVNRVAISVRLTELFSNPPEFFTIAPGDKIGAVNDEEYYDALATKKALEKRNKLVLRFIKNREAEKKTLKIDGVANSVKVVNPDSNRAHTFHLDGVFDEIDQESLFYALGEPVVQRILNGFNACVFMYGQTGSGKTYTMFGQEADNEAGLNVNEEQWGIVPRCVHLLYTQLADKEKSGEIQRWDVETTFLEVYRTKLTDLLNATQKQQPRLIDSYDGIMVSNLMVRKPRSTENMLRLIHEAISRRTVDAQQMNQSSSRSHMLMKLIIKTVSNDVVQSATLYFTDLAGSERARNTQSSKKKTMDEAKFINSSLMSLREAIKNLSQKKKVSWRDSPLTQVMKPVLQASNCLTSVIVCASKRTQNRSQTYDTLRFAEQAKKVETSAIKNKKLRREEMERIINELRLEKAQLERTLREKSLEQANAANNEELQDAYAKIEDLEAEFSLMALDKDTLAEELRMKDEFQREQRAKQDELKRQVEDLHEEVLEKKKIEEINQDLQRQLAEMIATNELLTTQNLHLEQEKSQGAELRETLKEFASQFQNQNESTERSRSGTVANDFGATLDKFAETQRELQQQLYETQHNLEQSREEKESLLDTIDEKDDIINKLETEVSSQDASLTKTEQEVTRLKKEIEVVEGKAIQYGRERDEEKQKVQRHKRETTMFGQQIDNLKLGEFKREQELADILDQLEEEKQINRDRSLIMRQKEEEMEQMQNQLDYKEDEIEELFGVKNELLKKHASLENHAISEKEKIQQELDQVQKQLQQNEENKKELESRVDAIAEEHKKEVEKLKKLLESREEEIQKRTVQIKELNEDITEKESVLDKVNREKEEQGQVLLEKETILYTLNRREQDWAEKENQLDEQSQEAAQLRDKLEKIRTQLEEKNTEVKEMKNNLTESDYQQKELENQLVIMGQEKIELADQKKSMENRQEQLKETEDQLNKVRNSLKEREHAYAQLEMEMKKQKQEKKELKNNIEDLELEQQSYEAHEAKYEELQGELSLKKDQLLLLSANLDSKEEEEKEQSKELQKFRKLENKLKEQEAELAETREKLEESWEKQTENLRLANEQREQAKWHEQNQIDADHAFAQALQKEVDIEAKDRKKKKKKKRAPDEEKSMHDLREDDKRGPEAGEDDHELPTDYPRNTRQRSSRIVSTAYMKKPAIIKLEEPENRNYFNYRYTSEIRQGETIRLYRPRNGIRGVVEKLMRKQDGTYVLGLRLKEPVGNSDGVFRGKRHFTCDPGYGYFTTSAVVTHVMRQNPKTNDLEKIRFECPSKAKIRRAAPSNARPPLAPEQKKRIENLIKNHKSLQNIVDEAFRQADKNGDGHIDLTEFSHLCVTLQLGYRSSFMQDLWDVLDVNNDDEMDRNEFEQFICDYLIIHLLGAITKRLHVDTITAFIKDDLLTDCLQMVIEETLTSQHYE